METITARAHPRVGLLGNPSDLYAGKVLGFTFTNFAARVSLSDALADGGDDAGMGEGGARLLSAALARWVAAHPQFEEQCRDLKASFETDIPRQAGLAGSSAVIVAALRACARRFEQPTAPEDLARMAQEAETEELGLIAGPQDRVLQAHGGLLAMDFTEEVPNTTRLDPQTLPPLLMAWDPEPGQPSGDVHAEVFARWNAGDPDVRRAMGELAALVDEGVQALAAADHERFAKLLHRNFDLRQSIFEIGDRDQTLIALGREAGAGAKLCGSGGAAIFSHPDEGDLERLAQRIAQAGWCCLRPMLDPEPGPVSSTP